MVVASFVCCEGVNAHSPCGVNWPVRGIRNPKLITQLLQHFLASSYSWGLAIERYSTLLRAMFLVISSGTTCWA